MLSASVENTLRLEKGESEAFMTADFKAKSNHYRLECGHYVYCGCIHEIGSRAYCLTALCPS